MKGVFFTTQDSRLNTQSCLRPRSPLSLLPLLPSSWRPLSGRHNPAFTLFELLAVLTVIGIIMVLVVGSYGSWGTAHALTGATRIVEAGLQQARATAMTKHAYVVFSYGNMETNQIQNVTGFQSFIFNLTNDATSVEVELNYAFTSPQSELDDIPVDKLTVTSASPFQRLTGHVRMAYIPEANISLMNTMPLNLAATYSEMLLFFRPDGSAFALGVTPDDKRFHYILVYTQQRFHRGNNSSEPLSRLLRIDLSTGLVTPEATL